VELVPILATFVPNRQPIAGNRAKCPWQAIKTFDLDMKPASVAAKEGNTPHSKVRAIIVDDELLARDEIRQLLALAPDLEVIGEADNGPEAIRLIREHRPQLLFLDIQMPEMNGFDVLKALPEEFRPATIVVSSHEQYAVKAFEIRAVDYLVKPITVPRFLEALERVRQLLAHTSEGRGISEGIGEIVHRPSHICVKEGKRTIFVAVEEIDYVESAANYAILHVGPETHILRETLTNLEAKLPSHRFLRVSRSCIVKLTFVDRAYRTSRRDRVLRLKNGREIPVTCRLKEIRRRLESL
jgi:two-component system LytT family response regulator